MASVKSGATSLFLSRPFKTSLLSHSRSISCLNLHSPHPAQPPTVSTWSRYGYHSSSAPRTSQRLQPLYSSHVGTRTPYINKSISLINTGCCRSISSTSSGGIGGRIGDSQSQGNKHNPPGTFVTGGTWDNPNNSASKTSTATLSSSSQSAPSTGISESPASKIVSARVWDALKEEISGDLEDKENSQSNIQMNIKKLEAISRVTKRKQAYSPYLWISQLPTTVMPDDIKRMEISEGSITDIIYHRNQYMEFLNRVTVVFRSATDAVEFITQKYGKYLSGHKLVMNMLDPYHPRDKRYIPPQLPPEPLSGQMVLVSGLPAASRPDHLRTEFRRFQLMDTTEAAIISVPSRRTASSCQYLIRLSSRSEAFRFVRTYHNTYYQYQEYRKRCPIRVTVIY
ncbi:hypothetical protein BGZ46_009334 [Entomortierella lignicola]|nr:hypothetical protein BGZ46_009334 [Entomortierella lignicola]